MMKKTSKLGYLLGLPILIGVFTLCFVNVVNGEVFINVPSSESLHRLNLKSLFLGTDSNDPDIWVADGNLNILNGLIMGYNSNVGMEANFVSIGGGKDNEIGSVEKSGIGGGNNNVVSTPYSVIGGGLKNRANGGSVNTIAGGQNNKTSSGGTVVGGSNNEVNGDGVIIGGGNNKLGGDCSMVLGSSSKGGNGSFSWNSPYIKDFSAIIFASGGVLIGTYEPIAGVNLVVSGGVKIGTGAGSGIEGEIRIKSGCFCGYNGTNWFLIDKTSGLDCGCSNATCTFRNIVLQVGDTLELYTEPYSLNCTKTVVKCNDDGVFGNGGDYYFYCFDIGEAKCGSANGRELEDSPIHDSLCASGDASEITVSDSKYTWSCSHADKVVNCSATRIYSCSGTNPDGGAEVGSEYYYFGYNNTSWTYKENGDLGACEWRCRPGFKKENEVCESSTSGSCLGNDQMFFNRYDYHIKQVNGPNGTNSERKVFDSEENAAGTPCSYVCDGGYEFLYSENRCIKCKPGSKLRDDNGRLIGCVETSKICPNGYYYNGESHKCLAYGNCRWNYFVKNVVPENTNIREIQEARPKDGTNKDWRYVSGTPRPNQCEYSCVPGYVPRDEYDDPKGPGCAPIFCAGDKAAGKTYVFTGGYPAYKRHSVNNRSYYEEYRKYHDSADSTTFINRASTQAGCYYWCKYVCKYDKNGYYQSDPQYWTCYEDQGALNQNCKYIPHDGPVSLCRGYYHSLRGYSKMTSSVGNWITEPINFQTYAYVGGFSQNSATGCLQGCDDNATSVFTYANYDICWKKCPDGQYFDMSTVGTYRNPCRSCPGNTLKPDMNSMTGTVGEENPVGCTDLCSPLAQCDGSEDDGICDSNGCKPIEHDTFECPEGTVKITYDTDANEQQCLSCPEGYELGSDSENGVYCYYMNPDGCDIGKGEYQVEISEGRYKCAVCPKLGDGNQTTRLENGALCDICGEGYKQVVNHENGSITVRCELDESYVGGE